MTRNIDVHIWSWQRDIQETISSLVWRYVIEPNMCKKVTLQYSKEVVGYDFVCYIYDQVSKIRQEI